MWAKNLLFSWKKYSSGLSIVLKILCRIILIDIASMRQRSCFKIVVYMIANIFDINYLAIDKKYDPNRLNNKNY